MERIQERLAASRFLTFSALLHAVLIFLGGGVVLYKAATDVPDFEAGGDLVSSDVQVQAPPEQPPDLTQQQFQPQTPQLNAPQLSAISTTNVSTPTFQVAAAVPAMSAPVDDSMKKALASAAQNVGHGLASGIPGTMASRVGGTARQKAMDMNGGKKESEEAVLRGLRWLVKNQNPDGSFGKSFRPAMTGFSLLAFLGHGESPVSTEFGPTIQKTLDWILTNGAKHKGRLSMEENFSQSGVYSHAIVSYALGEYYTMTKDERVEPLLRQAVDYILKGQAPDDGGWTYFHGGKDEPVPGGVTGYNNARVGGNMGSDTSVTGWQIQALKAAHLTGLNIDGVDAALDKAMLDLKRVQGPKGGYGYISKGDSYGLTGAGVLCTYFWKQEKDDSIRAGIKYLMEETEKDYPVKYKSDKANLYAWYYNTQACLMVGGAAWNAWNHMFQDELIKNQSPDGSWPPLAGLPPHTLQLQPAGDGPYYRTNLCILMLEVFYRYMPTTK